MKLVYISAHKREQAEALATKLKAAGHVVWSTWHTVAGPEDPKWCSTAEARFQRNSREIRSADTFVMIADPDHVRDYAAKNYDTGRFVTGGKFLELGYAVRLREEGDTNLESVLVVGGVENGMIGPGVVQVFDTDEQLLEALGE